MTFPDFPLVSQIGKVYICEVDGPSRGQHLRWPISMAKEDPEEVLLPVPDGSLAIIRAA